MAYNVDFGFRERYRIGSVVEIMADVDEIKSGSNVLLSMQNGLRVSRNKYPKFSKMQVDSGSIGSNYAFAPNPNWPQYYTRGITIDTTEDVNSYGTMLASNRKQGSGNKFVQILDQGNIYYGDTTDRFSRADSGSTSDLYEVSYSPVNDTWHFVGYSGRYLRGNDSNLDVLEVKNNLPASLNFTGNMIHACRQTGTVIVGNGANKIGRSTDDGDTWVDVGATVYIPFCMAEDSSGNLVMGTYSYRIYYSDDDGLTWNDLGAYGSGNVYDVDCNPNTDTFCFVNSSGVYRMTSYDATPVRVVTFTQKYTITWAGGNNWIAGGTNATDPLWHSIDDGLTWTSIDRSEYKIIHPRDEASMDIRCLEYNGVDTVMLTTAGQAVMISPSLDPESDTITIPRRVHPVVGMNYYIVVK